MDGCFGGKMKRRDFSKEEESFSSPPTKIRRLDCELMPALEENDVAAAMEFDQIPSIRLMKHEGGIQQFGYALPQCSTGEETALVVYEPANSSAIWLLGEESVPFKVSSELIDGIKNFGLNVGLKSIARMDEKTPVNDNNLALVPWVPSPILSSISGYDKQSECSKVRTDHEEAETASMEVDECNQEALTNGQASEGFQQWQQHCLSAQLLPVGLLL